MLGESGKDPYSGVRKTLKIIVLASVTHAKDQQKAMQDQQKAMQNQRYMQSVLEESLSGR